MLYPYGNTVFSMLQYSRTRISQEDGMVVYEVKDIGKALRIARKAQGLTQRDLADACRCGTRFISDLENGKQTIEMGLAIRVLNTVGLDLCLVER